MRMNENAASSSVKDFDSKAFLTRFLTVEDPRTRWHFALLESLSEPEGYILQIDMRGQRAISINLYCSLEQVRLKARGYPIHVFIVAYRTVCRPSLAGLRTNQETDLLYPK